MFRTLARVVLGFVLACIAAGLTTVLFVITPNDLMAAPSPEKTTQAIIWGLLAATHSAIFAAAFALIATGVAEWLGLRGLVYYLLAGTGIALLGFYAQYASEVAGQPTIYNGYAATAFIAAGLVAGFVYWLSAGRYAGGPSGVEQRPGPLATDALPKLVADARPKMERTNAPAKKAREPADDDG
ncbi:MAG: hypothetical protein ACKVP4_13480 [Hyphomicrobium sp.]